jgi:RHS repeat-associated protein
VISFFENAYDALNRAVTVTSTEGVAQYAYDLAGQLTRAAMPDGRILTYEYDFAGNRIRMTENASPTSYTANELNQVVKAGVWSYSYDKNGNLIGKSNGLQSWTLSYDVFQRLISQTTPGDVWSYEYDLLGFQSAVVHNGARTELVHDPVGQLLFAEYNGAGGLLAHYASGFGISSRVSPTGSHSFYAFDPAGTVVNLTGAAGNVLNTYRYDPFGQVVTQSETLPTPLRWLGQQGVLDHRDGLLNIGVRRYDARLGRFAQRDPLEMPGENVYLYAHNDPVNKKDIDGFWEISTNPDTGLQTSNDELGILGGSIKDAATSILNARIRTATDAAARYTDAAAAVLNNPRLIERDIEASAKGLKAVASQWSGMADIAKGKLSALTTNSKALKGVGYLGDAVTVADNLITLKDWNDGKATGLDLLNKTALTAAAGASKFPPFKILAAAPYVDYGSKQLFGWWFGGRYDPNDNDTFADPARAAEVRDRLNPRAPSKSTEQITPDDPNEIEGPSGVGAQRWLPASFDGWLDYTIRFENKPTASAAAQQVFVSSQLDPDLDWSTFEFGDVGLAYTRYVMPWTPNLDTRLDARASVSLYVGISATLNAATGELHWALSSIDPDSLAPTTDVLAGFLPPNDATSRGEGFVSYRVKAKPMLSTGTQITALAQIVFDSNDPIETNTFTNTLDIRGPSVNVSQLTTTTVGTQITVTWSGLDDAPISGTLQKLVAGSGIGSYDVFVVSDLFSMTRILTETTQTALTFNGVISHTYGFVIMASDAVGQLADWPAEVQTQTTLVLTNPKNRRAMLPIVRR